MGLGAFPVWRKARRAKTMCPIVSSDLVPLEMQGACTCAGNVMWTTHFKECHWSTVCGVVGFMCVGALFF